MSLIVDPNSLAKLDDDFMSEDEFNFFARAFKPLDEVKFVTIQGKALATFALSL
jgi:hypothetical protein